MKTQIHGGDHGLPTRHPYGIAGEHVHDYEWTAGERRPNRTDRDATATERIQHADILGGKTDDS